MKRALQLLDHFSIEPIVCVNKYDLNEENTSDIASFCSAEDIELVGMIPFDPNVTKAMVNGQPVVEYAPDSPASKAIVATWEKVKSRLV